MPKAALRTGRKAGFPAAASARPSARGDAPARAGAGVDGRRITPRDLASGALLAVGYFVAAKLALLLPAVHPGIPVVSPASGIALVVVLLHGTRVWPAIFLGALLVSATTMGSPLASLLSAVGQTLQTLLAAYLVNRLSGGPRAFDRGRTVMRFTVLAALFSTATGATAEVTSLALAGLVPSGHLGLFWAASWLGSAVGTVLITPVLVLWSANPRPGWTMLQALEAALIAASLVVVGEIVFGPWFPTGTRHYPLSYLLVPSLVWAALRFGPRETATTMLLTSALAISPTLRGFGPFAGETLTENVLLLQVPLGATAVLALGLGAVIAGRKRAEEERERLVGHLQDALAHVKALRGLLPICAACKRIRNAEGCWEAIEEYISNRSEADFTHGICPECTQRLYPQVRPSA